MRKLYRWLACRLWQDHRLRATRVSPQSDHLRCIDCGREWGINYDVGVAVPWHYVRGFYR